MTYTSRKEFTAILSLVSVGLTLMAALSLNIFLGKTTRWFTYVTVLTSVLAAASALITITLSRRLSKARANKRIFVIYSREDLGAAQQLSEELRRRGFNPWLDVEQITPGQIWPKAVLKALEESAAAVLLVSKSLFKGSFAKKELDLAMNSLQGNEKDISPIIPVRLDESEIPKNLSHIHWIDLNEQGLERLVLGLKKILESNQR